jgi:hypothetical protein
MRTDRAVIEAGQQYATPHAAHCVTKELHEALRPYKGVMVAHPDTQDAEYSRTQILNIVKSVDPNQEFLDAQTKLAPAHLEHEKPPDVEPPSVTPLTSELPSQRKAARSTGEAIR